MDAAVEGVVEVVVWKLIFELECLFMELVRNFDEVLVE